MTDDVPQPPLPQFDVRLTAPDLRPHLAGNTGVPGFTTLTGDAPGPHVMLVSIMHGNEIAGAIVLDRLLRSGMRPACGRLTLGFANIAAFERFDPRHPTASRFVDEDLNRLWDRSVLDGARHSVELGRARAMRPLIDTADMLLDLHSMLWPSDPLMLCGAGQRGRALAQRVGAPTLVVADHGHASGKRLIDYDRFTDPSGHAAANLLEAGQHWEEPTIAMTAACVDGLLRAVGMIGDAAAAEDASRRTATRQRFAEVTMAVTATTTGFSFMQPFRGGEIVRRRNTLIALDGESEIRTPHADCLLVMPSLRPSRGHTAVRLARFTDTAVRDAAAD